MKNIKLIIVLLVLVATNSCSFKYPYIQRVGILDYSEYAQKGFFITEATSVNFEYTPIGSMSAKSESGYEVLSIKKQEGLLDDVYLQNPESRLKMKYGKYVVATPEKAIEELYKRAIECKANGVIGLKVSPITTYYKNIGNVVTGYFVTGMAIRR